MNLLKDLLLAVQTAATADSLVDATRDLAAICSDLPANSSDQLTAINCLIELLSANNPGAAVAAVDGLIACKTAAVQPILNNLDEHNYGARAWAVRALAQIGDPRGLAVLQRAIEQDIGPSVRRAAAMGLGRIELAELSPEEKLETMEICLAGLKLGCADGEWIVRYAAVVGLENFSRNSSNSFAQACLRLLQARSQEAIEETPVVRLRAAQALAAFS
ncbi:HEAT repeat domain-containing protein [Synechococcus sp. Cruz CV12-2-Slac-r]|uniref:HEAT repeat domain-containing protein n=1 Tax=Synechococcus sp. Cruz CV12-2-Slac-r TaxID=2823748 RepID=UPI0020CD89E6|nr:HEAT repeat domain-containing protein [Synechococcus sp. Cruz CV12-2-Slac-r]MCP9938748.1 HEAT repeat domain-containing protein [Synechococcus sp. Cruz CV12-2-Slac-r]